MSFQRAIVRLPCKNISKALSSSDQGKPNYSKALDQHRQYVEALRQCGLEVIVLEADDHYPDSTFVEDTALLTPYCAVMTRPGALSRQGEVSAIEQIVERYFQKIEHIQSPGSLDGGDILKVEDHYYIGLSRRTNPEGAHQIISILKRYDLPCSTVHFREMLHLKSGVAYLEKGYLVTAGEFIEHPQFQEFKQIKIGQSESYAANCLWLNGKVLVAAGYPRVSEAIRKAGFEVIELNMSEFRKIDGGLSCLSLRF